MQMRLKSAAFGDGSMIPRVHTCDGRNVSPPLFWSGVPAEAKSLAILVDDPDAPGRTFMHWMVFDLPPTLTSLPEAIRPRREIEGGGTQGKNDFGNLGWGGPCPPSGTHGYVFTLYALSETLNLPERADREAFLRAIDGRVLSEAKLVGHYARSRGTRT